MEIFSLALHIISGTVALTTTFIAVPFNKGTHLHKASGRYYFYAMTVVFFTALHLSLSNNPVNWFLFCIGIFSYYLAFAGWRAGTDRVNLPGTIDWIVAIIMVVCSGFMFFQGYQLLISGKNIGWVITIFGGIGGSLAIQDLIQFRTGPIRGKERIIRHLSRILPSVIAVFTAVLVVNGNKLGIPQMVAWLGPTVVLTPVITLWNIWFRLPPSKRKGIGKRLTKQALDAAGIIKD